MIGLIFVLLGALWNPLSTLAIEPEIEWEKCLSSPAIDIIGIAVCEDNGFAILCAWEDSAEFAESASESQEYIVCTPPKTSKGILKLNDKGNQEWQRDIHWGRPKWISEDMTDGGFIVIGGLNPKGNKGCCLCKYNAQGDSLWFASYSIDPALALTGAVDAQDGALLLGIKATYDPDEYRIWMLRLNLDGDSLWSNTYSFDNHVILGHGMQTPDKGFLLGGFLSKDEKIFESGAQAFVVKLDSSGTIEWECCIDGDAFLNECRVVYEGTSGAYQAIVETMNLPTRYSQERGIEIVTLAQSGEISKRSRLNVGLAVERKWIDVRENRILFGGEHYGDGTRRPWATSTNLEGDIEWEWNFNNERLGSVAAIFESKLSNIHAIANEPPIRNESKAESIIASSKTILMRLR